MTADQSSPDTTWPDGTMQQIAVVVYERAGDAAAFTAGGIARAVLAALGPVITERYVPRAEHEKLRADVLALAERHAAPDPHEPGECGECDLIAELRALVNGDTP